VTNYLSFDVEEWFHSYNLQPSVGPEDWEHLESRVVGQTRRVLELLDDHDTSATFFVLGWVAERNPELVGEIERRGHEIASHGYAHELIYDQTPEEFRDDIERSRSVLEEITTGRIRGYRAPNFSITDWSITELVDAGFRYDSSLFSTVYHDRYGDIDATVPDGETFVFVDDIVEARMSDLSVGPVSLPWAGGGYFRFCPYRLFEYGLRHIATERDVVFYFHPWELDDGIPVVDGLPRTSRIRHYRNLSRMERRLDALLEAFDWQPIGDAPEIAAGGDGSGS